MCVCMCLSVRVFERTRTLIFHPQPKFDSIAGPGKLSGCSYCDDIPACAVICGSLPLWRCLRCACAEYELFHARVRMSLIKAFPQSVRYAPTPPPPPNPRRAQQMCASHTSRTHGGAWGVPRRDGDALRCECDVTAEWVCAFCAYQNQIKPPLNVCM